MGDGGKTKDTGQLSLSQSQPTVQSPLTTPNPMRRILLPAVWSDPGGLDLAGPRSENKCGHGVAKREEKEESEKVKSG